MSRGGLGPLLAVTAARFRAAEARMAALQQAERAIVAQLEGLQDAALARLRARDVTDAALRAGVDLRWEGWIAARRQHLNARRALIRAQIEGERQHLARAFGQKTAMEQLLEEQAKAAALQAGRRALREG